MFHYFFFINNLFLFFIPVECEILLHFRIHLNSSWTIYIYLHYYHYLISCCCLVSVYSLIYFIFIIYQLIVIIISCFNFIIVTFSLRYIRLAYWPMEMEMSLLNVNWANCTWTDDGMRMKVMIQMYTNIILYTIILCIIPMHFSHNSFNSSIKYSLNCHFLNIDLSNGFPVEVGQEMIFSIYIFLLLLSYWFFFTGIGMTSIQAECRISEDIGFYM